jgi:DNA invertase Pin-like site-specific DNA recombinase
VTLGADLRARKVGLHVIEQGIDTPTTEGLAMFGMLSVLAELQRELIVANTMDGLASAQARGRVGGRWPRLTPDQAAFAQEPYNARIKTVQQITDLFGVPAPPSTDTSTRPRQYPGNRRRTGRTPAPESPARRFSR